MLADQLKTHTAHVHERLEKRLDIFSRMQTLEDYKKLLVKFYQFYHVIEPKLRVYESDIPYAGREKLPLLKNDLIFLGFTQKDLDGLPVCPYLPSVTSLSQAVGVMYVLEGSTLGAQFIYRHLHKTFQIIPEAGGQFFCGYQERTMEMWQSFKKFLNHYEITHKEETSNVLESSMNTFSTLETWLCS